MKKEFIHEFKGFFHIPSKCVVKIFSEMNNPYICFEDIGEGTSVTNASEQLASEIVNMLDFDPADCRFFETYRQYNYDSFDEIKYTWNMVRGEWVAKEPDWSPASEEIRDLFLTL